MISASTVGQSVGLALIISAGLLWAGEKLTEKSRLRSGEQGRRDARRHIHSAKQTGQLLPLEWNDAFECGHPLIDSQHLSLFLLANELIDELIQPSQDEQFLQSVDRLLDGAQVHFRTEEMLFRDLGVPLDAEHGATHLEAIARAQDLRDRFARGTVGRNALLRILVHGLVIEHVVSEDIETQRRLQGLGEAYVARR